MALDLNALVKPRNESVRIEGVSELLDLGFLQTMSVPFMTACASSGPFSSRYSAAPSAERHFALITRPSDRLQLAIATFVNSVVDKGYLGSLFLSSWVGARLEQEDYPGVQKPRCRIQPRVIYTNPRSAL